MKRKIFTILLSFLSFAAFAHEGEDHGADKKAAATGAASYFSSEALSDKYEVLVKYGELEGRAESTLRLFLSDARTNQAIDSATIRVKVLNQPNLDFTLTRVDTGIYQLKGVFPNNEIYDLQVNIDSRLGPDFLQVSKIEVGKKLEAPADAAHDHWYDNPWIWAVIGLLFGLVLMYLLMRSRYRKAAVTAMIIALLVPTASMNPSIAHEGEDHGAGGAAKGGGLSSAFIVEKESQFLFDILTEKTGAGNFYQSTELIGTITASPQGLAVIQAPQTGKIVALRVTPGQSVNKGQTLAVVEQQVEAGTQIDIISQRNALNAEVKAAKVQYDRLLTIADIAAKKDLTEAKARYEAAVQNLALFNSNIGGGAGTKTVSLTAPISGVIGTFNYAIGAVVSAGQTLFEITNLYRVYVETQVFSSDLADANKGGRFVAYSNSDTVTHNLRMVSTAQSVNTENQAQRIVFELDNPGGKFKIGENVRVIRYGNNRIAQLVIPTAAITDVNGKPAVFIKDKAEQYNISFVQKGESNAIYTAIIKGVESGERVVTGNIYQMKMIYLNQ